MRKKLLLPIAAFLALAMLVAMGACSTDELMPDTKPNGNVQERTISFTASMPGDGPATRVALTPEADKSITLTWEVGDKLQLAFVQGATKVKHTVTLTAQDITNQGKKAIFELVIPDEIVEGPPFDLYGVYGGGKRKLNIGVGLPGNDEAGEVGIGSFYTGDALVLGDANTNPYIKLPTNAGSATSLAGADGASIQNRKDVMLYFQSTGIDLNNPAISVAFQHLGSLFCITLKNTGTTSIENLHQAQLVGINNPDNQNWAFNGEAGGQTYDLVTKEFKSSTTMGNFIAFKAAQTSLPADASITFWAWYPPMPAVNWPSLRLYLKDGTTSTIAESKNYTPARTAETPAGRAFYFFASWDGAELNFTSDLFTNELTIHVAEKGTLSTLLSASQKTYTTKLTLTGQINEVDYEVMKSHMPSLTHLDLSQVTSYEGETTDKIPNNAFGEDIGLSMANISINIIRDKNLESIILPTSVTSIGDYAFSGCIELAGDLNLPPGLTTLGKGAFANCRGYTGNLFLPASLEIIGESAFADCDGFTSLTFEPGSQLTTIGAKAFDDCDGFTGNLIIPNTVTTIEAEDFGYCFGFTSLTFEAGSQLKTIGAEAFEDCDGFTGDLIIPNTVTTVGARAFGYCYGFTSLTFEAGSQLTAIGAAAFYKCDFKGNLIIPNKVTTIGDRAFYRCDNFDGSLTFEAGSQLTTIGTLAFYDCDRFTGDLVLPDNLMTIGEGAFKQCTFTGSLTIPSKVTTIEKEAFYHCPNFDGTLTFQAGSELTTIGQDAFYACDFTGDLTLPASLQTIGKCAFQSCEFNGSLTFEAGIQLTKIENFVFSRCNFTGDLSLPVGLQTIGEYAFQNCNFNGALTFQAGSHLTTIGDGAFDFCDFTGSLTIPNKVTTIGDMAFYNCVGFTSLLFEPGSQLTTIGANAFSGDERAGVIYAPGFTGTIIFPSTLSSMGSQCFVRCQHIDAFQFPHTTPFTYSAKMLWKLESEVGTTRIQVPNTAIDAYKGALGWSDHTAYIVEIPFN